MSTETRPAINVDDLVAGYGRKPVIRNVSFAVADGTISALIGANGAGKSTLLRAIFGLADVFSGRVSVQGKDVTGFSPRRLVQEGTVLVPQGGPSFGAMTVMENLSLAAFAAGRELTDQRLRDVYELFPVLESRSEQLAGSLSGGERGMLALSRALVADPRVLLLDEPSIGLSPVMVGVISDAVKTINSSMGVTVVLVEQNLAAVRRIADSVSLVKKGTLVGTDLAPQDLTSEVIRSAYLV